MGISTEMKMTLCTDLACHHVVHWITNSLHCATVLPSNSYYTVVASIFLVSTDSSKAICGVALVRTSNYSQPFWLK